MAQNSVSHKDQADCCGCGNCANRCAKNAIVMKTDSEGYEYPVVHEQACINCGLCLKVCPMEDVNSKATPCLNAFAGRVKNDSDLQTVASGGICTALSEAIIVTGGVVYGAAYSSDFKSACVSRVDKVADLDKLKGSKYFQTSKGDIVKQVNQDIHEGRKVLYIGMPCDVAAVKRYIGESENLFTIDVICSGVPSPLAHRQFVEHIENKTGEKVLCFTYRNKKHGWHWPYIVVRSNGKVLYSKPWSASELGLSFKMMMRPSCYHCKYKSGNNVADVTVGDFWGLKSSDQRYDKDGVSAIIVRSEKGSKLVSLLDNLTLQDATYDEIVAHNPKLVNCAMENPKRQLFADTLVQSGIMEATEVCTTMKDRVANVIKTACAILNINLK